ncbi:hypothetical protein ACQ4PT_065611 [Festuca glaucescens]
MASGSGVYDEQENAPSPPRVKRKLTSVLWNEFNKVLANGELKDEEVSMPTCGGEELKAVLGDDCFFGSGMASPTQSSSAAADGETPVSSLVPTPTPSSSAANGTPAASTDLEEVPSQTPRETEPQDAHKVAGVRRKLKSPVWDEFERVLVGGKMKAECQWCHNKLVGETKDGTSHLRAHLATCAARQTTTAWKQAKLKLTKGEDGKVNVENYVFDQELCRKQLALMLCCHEYPLSIVDHAGFRKFCSILQPMFKVVSRQTIRKDIIEMHEGQRDKMIKYFANFKNRVAVTSDLWTAGHQRRGYMAVTAHYIDGSWNLKSFLLRFVYVPAPHTAAVLCEVLHEVLVEFHLERKISTITPDNCTTNDKAVEELQDKLDSSSLMLGGKMLHMRCCAHILNLIVKDGLAVLGDCIERVRDSVGFWSATPKRHEKFEKTCRLMNIDYSKRLSLDCKTRWNSTYIMLSIAVLYREVFDRLSLREKQFNCCPSTADWNFAKEMIERLKLFYDITSLWSGKHYVTANLFFPKVCGINLAIRKWTTPTYMQLDEMPEQIRQQYQIMQQMSEEMKKKFDKY